MFANLLATSVWGETATTTTTAAAAAAISLPQASLWDQPPVATAASTAAAIVPSRDTPDWTFHDGRDWRWASAAAAASAPFSSAAKCEPPSGALAGTLAGASSLRAAPATPTALFQRQPDHRTASTLVAGGDARQWLDVGRWADTPLAATPTAAQSCVPASSLLSKVTASEDGWKHEPPPPASPWLSVSPSRYEHDKKAANFFSLFLSGRGEKANNNVHSKRGIAGGRPVLHVRGESNFECYRG